MLAQNYASTVVDRLKALGYAARAGDVTLKLAREFGFCYGVDRAVEYAYETRQQFPDRRVFLSGEIIGEYSFALELILPPRFAGFVHAPLRL